MRSASQINRDLKACAMPPTPAPQPRPQNPAPTGCNPIRRQSLRDVREPDNAADLHANLLEPVLPLLASPWQRARLSIGQDGSFTNPPACRPEDRLEVDLRVSQRPSLTLLGDARIALSYNAADLDEARSALTAIAAWSGQSGKGGAGNWPIARDEASLALLTLAQRIAASEIPVLLEGPTGTGKEVLARFVHRRSRRADGPFVAVNCAAMPEAMLEGMLFGHRKGAFTGASEAREGLFCAADGGTLLLDEIGELPLALQAKLLRVLQEGEVLPLGATRPSRVDVRIIAATNRRLASEVEAGAFREDLLYRLNVFPLEIPALRERADDIAPLAFGMLLRHACRPQRRQSDGAPGPQWLSADTLRLLERHSWPGNVRELENVIRRAILLAGDASEIAPDHIVFDRPVRALEDDQQGTLQPFGQQAASAASLADIAFRSEAEAIVAALNANNGHRAKTASALGISERTLRYRLASMRELGLLSQNCAAVGGEA